MKTQPTPAFSLATVAVACLTAHAAGEGLERFWDSPLGGCFNEVKLWVDGGELGIPGPADPAIFDLASLYLVCFPQN